MHQYNITVEIFAVDYEPLVETIDIECDEPQDMTTIDEKIGGFPNSPIAKIMDEKNIYSVKDWKVVSFDEVKPTENHNQKQPIFFGEVKKYSDGYGLGITNEGQEIPVTDYCGHDRVNRFGYDEGWIAVVTFTSEHHYSLSFRFRRSDVSKKALRALVRIIKTSNYPSYYVDFGMEGKNTYSSARVFSKQEVLRELSIIIMEKLKNNS